MKRFFVWRFFAWGFFVWRFFVPNDTSAQYEVEKFLREGCERLERKATWQTFKAFINTSRVQKASKLKENFYSISVRFDSKKTKKSKKKNKKCDTK